MEGRWTDRKEERCVSGRLRKAGEWKGAFAAEGECVKKASTICNSLVKKIDCLNRLMYIRKELFGVLITMKGSHLLCCTKLTAMLVGTNCEGPSFLLSRFLISLNFASSVASILRIFAL